MLLNSENHEIFMLENPGKLELAWKISNIEELEEANFIVKPSFGVLRCGEKYPIHIKFKALREEKVSK